MLRLRLAGLALACGIAFTLTGCRSMCEEGRLFPRLFNHNSMSPLRWQGAECECHHGHMPPGFEAAHGPVLVQPGTVGTTMPPITNVPVTSQPPQVFKVPSAPATPYVPSIN